MQGLISGIKLLMSWVCTPIGLSVIAILVLLFIKDYYEYKKSSYYSITHNSYLSVNFDIGKYGEYLTYKELKKYEHTGAKFLFNAYIPKGNDGTTEIDVMMICSKGIFVFESKNYSGWIFGSEDQKNWYQTLRRGKGKSRKEQFYNPIMQNQTHIKYLKELVGENILMKSIITFSNRCTLKSIKVKSNDVNVINRRYVKKVVKKIYSQTTEEILSVEQIKEIYDKVYPYTQVCEAVKVQHIADIQKNNKLVEEVSIAENIENSSLDNMKTVDEVKDEVQNMKCPKCGNELILRTAKRGVNTGNKFYGCSNYPKCKYVQEVM